MLFKSLLCLISPVLMYICHHHHHHHCYYHDYCNGSNWLEEKRQLGLEQQRLNNEQKLEKLRLETEQKRIDKENKRLSKEERTLHNDKKSEQVMARLDELEKLLIQAEQERAAAKEEAEAPQKQPAKADQVSEQKQKTRKKNRLAALRLFRAKTSGLWITADKQLPAFRDKALCEEYLEYECSLPDYCRRFLSELDSDEVVYMAPEQHLTYVSDNGADLVPTEKELQRMAEDTPDAKRFDATHSALQFLQTNAQVMGLVELRTDSGKTYWMTYRDLSSSARQKTSETKD